METSSTDSEQPAAAAREQPAAPAPRDLFPRWVWLAGAGGLLAIGWLFILIQNRFHLTAPVVFVCLGYGAGVAAVYTLFRMGASAVTASSADADAASWGRPVGTRGELEREKRALLKAIKEAEFDLAMGKLSKVDAEVMIAGYRAQAIAVIKEIDREEGVEASARAQIEREVRARLTVTRQKPPADAEKRSAGKKADKGKRGGGGKPAPAPAAKPAPAVAEERVLDATPAPAAAAADDAAAPADDSPAAATPDLAEAAAQATAAGDADGAPASAKEATP